MAGSSAWKMFLWIIQDFIFDISKSLYFWKCRTSRLYIVGHLPFLLVSGSPSRVCLCPSCLRRFGDLRKNTPLDFWSMYLVSFVIFCRFQPPQALCVCVRAACGASATSEKTRPWILEHVFCGVCDFKAILRSPGKCSSYGRSAQMTMPARRASKFCAKRCVVWLPIFFLSLIS